MYGVGVIVAHITSNLNRIRHIDEFEFPFGLWATFFDVIDMLQSLQMLVRFAVQLEVRFQVGLVRAQFADTTATNRHQHLVFARTSSITFNMLT